MIPVSFIFKNGFVLLFLKIVSHYLILAGKFSPFDALLFSYDIKWTSNVINLFWQLTKAYFAFLEVLFNSHISFVLNLDTSTFMRIVGSLESGLKGLDTNISAQVGRLLFYSIGNLSLCFQYYECPFICFFFLFFLAPLFYILGGVVRLQLPLKLAR